MTNLIIVRAYVQALEGIIDNLNIEQYGVGAITEKPKYHIKDSSVVKLIRATAQEINYDNSDRSYGESPREVLYWSFNGHGLDSPKEIRKELSNLIRAAKEILPVQMRFVNCRKFFQNK